MFSPPPPRGYITAYSGDLNADLPTRQRFRPVLDQFISRWAEPTPELLQSVLDGLDNLSPQPPQQRDGTHPLP